MKKQILILITFFFIVIISKAQDSTTRLYLCDKKWQITSWTVSPAYEYWRGKGKENDLLKNEQACKKDDYYTFTYKRTFTLNNGQKKCLENEGGVIEKGTWNFIKGGAKNFINIRSTSGSFGIQRKITSLTESKLVWTNKEEHDGVIYTFTETYNVFDAISTPDLPMQIKTLEPKGK